MLIFNICFWVWFANREGGGRCGGVITTIPHTLLQTPHYYTPLKHANISQPLKFSDSSATQQTDPSIACVTGLKAQGLESRRSRHVKSRQITDEECDFLKMPFLSEPQLLDRDNPWFEHSRPRNCLRPRQPATIVTH